MTGSPARRWNWRRLTVTLTDERWVDRASPLSNEKLVRDRLLVGPAQTADLIPLMGEGAELDADVATADAAVRTLGAFDATLLGMGPDGHIASLFPDAPGLAGALDPDGPAWCVAVPTSPDPPFTPRISLTLRALLASAITVLLVTGAEKRALIERVLVEPDFSPPVAAILRQDRRPVRILWAP